MEIKVRQRHRKAINIDLATGKIIKKAPATVYEKQAIIYCRVSTDKQIKE